MVVSFELQVNVASQLLPPMPRQPRTHLFIVGSQTTPAVVGDMGGPAQAVSIPAAHAFMVHAPEQQSSAAVQAAPSATQLAGVVLFALHGIPMVGFPVALSVAAEKVCWAVMLSSRGAQTLGPLQVPPTCWLLQVAGVAASLAQSHVVPVGQSESLWQVNWEATLHWPLQQSSSVEQAAAAAAQPVMP